MVDARRNRVKPRESLKIIASRRSASTCVDGAGTGLGTSGIHFRPIRRPLGCALGVERAAERHLARADARAANFLNSPLIGQPPRSHCKPTRAMWPGARLVRLPSCGCSTRNLRNIRTEAAILPKRAAKRRVKLYRRKTHRLQTLELPKGLRLWR
jgi:hypothetical protein